MRRFGMGMTMLVACVVVTLATVSCSPVPNEIDVNLNVPDCPAGIPIFRVADADSLDSFRRHSPLCPYAYINFTGDTVVVRPGSSGQGQGG